jgi:hypothetical protein
MPRKTIEVAYLVQKGNYFLAHSEDEQREQRLGVCSMIELALHNADAYAGYSHLDTAGVNYEAIAAGERFADNHVDDTRRAYMQKGQPYPTTVAANVKATS